jgi:hypothetical protein
MSCTSPHRHLTWSVDFQEARSVCTSALTRVGARRFVFGHMKVSSGALIKPTSRAGPETHRWLRLGQLFDQERLYRSPNGLVGRGLQQLPKPLNVGVCDVGEVTHRQSPLRRRSNPQQSLVHDYNARRCQICSKLLTRNPVPPVTGEEHRSVVAAGADAVEARHKMAGLVRHVRDVDGSLNTGPASAGLLVLPQSRPDEVS